MKKLNVIGLMKDRLREKKTYRCLTDNSYEKEQSQLTHKRLLLQFQHRLRSEKHNLFTEKVDKIDFGANGYKRIKRTDSRETYYYVTNKDIIRKNEEIKYRNIIKK